MSMTTYDPTLQPSAAGATHGDTTPQKQVLLVDRYQVETSNRVPVSGEPTVRTRVLLFGRPTEKSDDRLCKAVIDVVSTGRPVPAPAVQLEQGRLVLTLWHEQLPGLLHTLEGGRAVCWVQVFATGEVHADVHDAL